MSFLTTKAFTCRKWILTTLVRLKATKKLTWRSWGRTLAVVIGGPYSRLWNLWKWKRIWQSSGNPVHRDSKMSLLWPPSCTRSFWQIHACGLDTSLPTNIQTWKKTAGKVFFETPHSLPCTWKSMKCWTAITFFDQQLKRHAPLCCRGTNLTRVSKNPDRRREQNLSWVLNLLEAVFWFLSVSCFSRVSKFGNSLRAHLHGVLQEQEHLIYAFYTHAREELLGQGKRFKLLRIWES